MTSWIVNSVEPFSSISSNAPGSVLNLLYGTLAILVVSNVIHYFTVGFLTATTALKQMDAEFENVSASLGVPFYTTFWRVTVPMALPAIVGISMYFFLNSMVTLSPGLTCTLSTVAGIGAVKACA